MTESHCLNMAPPAGKSAVGMLFIVVILMLTQAGCAQQRIYENLYEGIRIRNELQTLPSERGVQQTSPDYWQYQNTLHTGKSDAL
ncbi:MAG: hypothetical protein PHI06_14465 [Desulfobulbaceae bacterium]|nr:hypothetical protein [Desulfobulbaceae bacterium]